MYRAEGPGNWTHIHLPIDAAALFGSNGFIAVKGKIDDYVFTGLKLAPKGHCLHRLSINEKIRKAIGKASGDWVNLELEHDPVKKEVLIPDDFLAALQAHPAAMDFLLR